MDCSFCIPCKGLSNSAEEIAITLNTAPNVKPRVTINGILNLGSAKIRVIPEKIALL
jgi:hypothetical protein